MPWDPRHRLRIKTFLMAMLIVAVMLGAARFSHRLPYQFAQWILLVAGVALAVFPWLVRYHPVVSELGGYVMFPLAIIAAAAVLIGWVGHVLPLGQSPPGFHVGFGGCCLATSGAWILWLVWLGIRYRGK